MSLQAPPDPRGGPAGETGCPAPARAWAAAGAAAVLLAALFVGLNALWTFETIQRFNRLGRPAAGRVERRSVFADTDCMLWNLNALQVAGGGAWRIRRATLDNAPYGRESHWSSGYAWLLAAAGRAWSAATGEGLRTAVERASLLVNPALHLILVAAAALLAARRLGGAAGAATALAIAGSAPILGTFDPGGPDHHALITMAAAGAFGALFLGGAGFVRDRPPGDPVLPCRGFDLPDERGARRWFALSAVCVGAGLWVSAVSMTIVLAAIGAAVVLASLLRRRGATEAGVRHVPGLWAWWGSLGALVGFAFYLVEYFPGHLGWRLEVNHPLHHLALWGASRLLAAWTAYRFAGVVPGRGGRARLAAAVLAVALLPALVAAGGSRFFLMREGLLARVTEAVFEFKALPVPVLLEQFGALLAVWVAAAALARRRGTEPGRASWATFALVAPLLPLALTLHQGRWASLAAAALLAAPGALLVAGAAPRPRWARWLAPCLLLLLLAQFGGLAQRQLSSVRRVRDAGVGESLYGYTVALREAAEYLRGLEGSRDVVLLSTPSASTELAWYGGFRSVSSLYWENAAGMQAGLDVLTARTDDEALALLRARGVTHLAFPLAEFSPGALYYWQHGRAGAEQELLEMFGTRLYLGQWPPWVQPVPFASAFPEFRANLRLYGVALFRVDPAVLRAGGG